MVDHRSTSLRLPLLGKSPGSVKAVQLAERTCELPYAFGTLDIVDQDAFYVRKYATCATVIRDALEYDGVWPAFDAKSLSAVCFGDTIQDRSFLVSRMARIQARILQEVAEMMGNIMATKEEEELEERRRAEEETELEDNDENDTRREDSHG